jgi:type I restriction enzyme, R subunit
MPFNKKSLSERDISTQFITPAIQRAGWDFATQVREKVFFTAGQILVKGKAVRRAKGKRADYILYYRPNIPVAVVEAKDNKHPVGGGMQQALGYADETALALPFAFSSNGDAFLFHDKTGTGPSVERELMLDEFPSPADLWDRYCRWKELDAGAQRIVTQDFYADGSGKSPAFQSCWSPRWTRDCSIRGRRKTASSRRSSSAATRKPTSTAPRHPRAW